MSEDLLNTMNGTLMNKLQDILENIEEHLPNLKSLLKKLETENALDLNINDSIPELLIRLSDVGCDATTALGFFQAMEHVDSQPDDEDEDIEAESTS